MKPTYWVCISAREDLIEHLSNQEFIGIHIIMYNIAVGLLGTHSNKIIVDYSSSYVMFNFYNSLVHSCLEYELKMSRCSHCSLYAHCTGGWAHDLVDVGYSPSRLHTLILYLVLILLQANDCQFTVYIVH